MIYSIVSFLSGVAAASLFYYKTHVQRVGRKLIINYSVGLKSYKLVIPVRLTMRWCIRILDENRNDVTEYVRAFMGPNEDFHGISVNIEDLGFTSLTFIGRHGESRTFTGVIQPGDI